jgi:hypothetical protein
MSTPYTPTGGTQAGEFAYDYDDEHGQRLVTSAGVMLMIAAVLNTLYGIAATDKANFLVHDARYVFGDVNTWGWLLLAFGVVQFSAAFDPARRLLGPVARRRRRERQRDSADDVDPRLSDPRDGDPDRGHRHLRAAGLRRPSQRRARGVCARRGRRGELSPGRDTMRTFGAGRANAAAKGWVAG